MARGQLSHHGNSFLVRTPCARRGAQRRAAALAVVLAAALAGGVAGQLSARDAGGARLTPLSYVPQ
jgi:hypothetical protein